MIFITLLAIFMVISNYIFLIWLEDEFVWTLFKKARWQDKAMWLWLFAVNVISALAWVYVIVMQYAPIA